MKYPLNNQLFSSCLANPEPLIDPFYCSEQLIISADSSSPPTAIMQLWEQVRDRLTVADVALMDADESGFARQIEVLDKLLEGPSANFLELTSFFPALDVSYSMYRNLPREPRIDFLSRAVIEFIKKRHRTYMSHGYSPVTVQVRRDFEKHKGGGSSAKRKVEALLGALGYVHATTVAELNSIDSFVHADSELFGIYLRKV